MCPALVDEGRWAHVWTRVQADVVGEGRVRWAYVYCNGRRGRGRLTDLGCGCGRGKGHMNICVDDGKVGACVPQWSKGGHMCGRG